MSWKVEAPPPEAEALREAAIALKGWARAHLEDDFPYRHAMFVNKRIEDLNVALAAYDRRYPRQGEKA